MVGGVARAGGDRAAAAPAPLTRLSGAPAPRWWGGLCEPDPVHYDEQFARLLAALSEVSPVVEPAELGRAYVGTDGLKGLYGAPQQIVKEIQLRIVNCGLRIGNSHVQSAIDNPQFAIR